MSLYFQFEEITLEERLRKIAKTHAQRRTDNIVRQFVPQNAPLNPIESNYVGVIGEMAVRKFLGLDTNLDDNYENHQVDEGDLSFNGLIYDVKTDAIPSTLYQKLYNGTIQPWDTYGCRVFTAKHLHHLKKYSGGLIFTAFEIPNDAKSTKIEGQIRPVIIDNSKILIIGYVSQKDVTKNEPTWFTPANPINGATHKYNSLNYIFHHTDLTELKKIL